MSAVPEPRYTIEEYLARERVAPHKSEYYHGQIFAMAGGSTRHNRTSGNIFGSLWGRLNGTSCHPNNSDQRIHIPAIGLSTYPDVSIVCGELKVDPDDRDAIINPRVVFEVLSDSTESYDRGRKFSMYRQLESLREYVLVAQDEPHIERYVRQDNDAWMLTELKGLDAVLELSEIQCVLPLSEIYQGVTFGPEVSPTA